MMLGPSPDGLLVLDKPADWTSHDVVARSRRLCATRRVGHAGTLDPMATGVLVLGIGRGTKLLTFLVGADKDYVATIRLGQSTITDDAQGALIEARSAAKVDRESLEREISLLTGDIDQVPSAVSAIKVNGQRSYHRVRSGESVELAARAVRVERFAMQRMHKEIVDGVEVLDVDVEVRVSSGTYVRALARDLGTALEVGGHLRMLRRTRVGGFGISMAHELASLEGTSPSELPVIPLAQAARAALTVRELTAPQARAISFGQRIESALPGRTEPVAAFGPDGILVAILDESSARTRAHVVFAPATS